MAAPDVQLPSSAPPTGWFGNHGLYFTEATDRFPHVAHGLPQESATAFTQREADHMPMPPTAAHRSRQHCRPSLAPAPARRLSGGGGGGGGGASGWQGPERRHLIFTL